MQERVQSIFYEVVDPFNSQLGLYDELEEARKLSEIEALVFDFLDPNDVFCL